MSLREKQLWASLVVGAVVWAAYAAWVVPLLLAGSAAGLARSVGLAFVAALVAATVAEAALAGVVAWFQRRQRPAQEDALTQAGLIAGQAAQTLLAGLVAVILCGLLLAAVFAPGLAVDLSRAEAAGLLLLAAHALLAVLLLSEGVRAVLTLLLVRRRR